jgi:hypothetical protein
MVAFLACAVFGAVLLVALLVSGAAGGDGGHAGPEHGSAHGTDAVHHPPSPAALALLVVGLRPMAAAVAFFGLAGAAVLSRGGSVPAALGAAGGAGLAAALTTAALFRLLLRFEHDGTVRLDRALGAEGTVYLAIPPGGAGKVQLALQGRLVECSATAADGAAYPTGARVLVVDVAPGGGLLVAADPAAPAGRGAPSSLRSSAS